MVQPAADRNHCVPPAPCSRRNSLRPSAAFRGLGEVMLRTDFMAHLVRKGVLRDAAALEGAGVRQRDMLGDTDWAGLTRLTASAFADELAAFYRCDRVDRGMMIGG